MYLNFSGCPFLFFFLRLFGSPTILFMSGTSILHLLMVLYKKEKMPHPSFYLLSQLMNDFQRLPSTFLFL